MSHFKLKVGQWSLLWKELPKGKEGSAWVQVNGGESLEVHWKVDSQGLWLRTKEGLFGYDLVKTEDDSGQKNYLISQRHEKQYWQNVSVDLGDSSSKAQSRGPQQKVIRLKSQMPGKIIRVLVQPGQVLVKDQPVMVMEAMKMENEIKAPQAGRVSQVNLKEGQAVESGAELLRIEPLDRDLS
jgi:biotin carboxyl carrier protein